MVITVPFRFDTRLLAKSIYYYQRKGADLSLFDKTSAISLPTASRPLSAIITAFMSDMGLRRDFRLDCIIATVSFFNIQQQGYIQKTWPQGLITPSWHLGTAIECNKGQI